MRELLPFALLVCACGAAVRDPAPPSPAPPATALTAPDAASPESPAAFDALAARGAAVAPGMREIARKEGGADAVELAKAESRDVCVRVAFEASAPVSARLVDRAGHELATTESPGPDGVLGAHGPVCIRKGDVVRGLSDATGATRVRWVAWAAP